MVGSHKWVVVTGISGSGRTTALRALEDIGYFCVDNLPASLVASLHDTLTESGDEGLVAVGIGVRGGILLDDLEAAIGVLEGRGERVELVFLDCADRVLIRRFAETRRRHPLLRDGTLSESIAQERLALLPLRERTLQLIDTTDFNLHELKRHVQRIFATVDGGPRLVVSVVSFGFKYGIPREADYIFDVRFLANPYFIQQLRPQTGLDAAVRDHVFDHGGDELVERLDALIQWALPRHADEGRTLVTLALGCTGGRHRSVAIAEAIGARIAAQSLGRVTVRHRDIGELAGQDER